MSDSEHGEHGERGEHGEHGEHGEPVGSVGEEAAKLFDALQDWARTEDGGGAAAGVEGLVDGLADRWRVVNEHVATGGQDCTYCPVCQAIHKVRAANPEVRTHLAVAASSLLQAAATLIEARAAGAGTAATDASTAEPHVTKIDLDDEEPPRG